MLNICRIVFKSSNGLEQSPIRALWTFRVFIVFIYLFIHLFIYLFIYLLLEYFYIFQARSQETSFSVFHYANGRLAVRLFEGKRMQCYQWIL